MNQEIKNQNLNEMTQNEDVKEVNENSNVQDANKAKKGTKTTKSKQLKKKIFIAGAVREYDSANPKVFTAEIEDYIKTKLVNPESAGNITVTTDEIAPNGLRIIYNFGTGVIPDYGRISREMYRCLTGECKDFMAENSLWWTFGFGPNYPMNVFFPIEQTIAEYKKNAKFYGADKYKKLTLVETGDSLHIFFKF